MNIIPHTFKNINKALDFILCEEDEAIKSDKYRLFPEQIFSSHKESPFACFINNFPIDGFIVNRLFSARYNFKPNLRHRKFLFRGQNSLIEPCVPNLYRDKNKNYFIDDMIRGQESMLLMLSHPLVQLLDLGVCLGGKNFVIRYIFKGKMEVY